MHVHRKKGWEIPERDATPESVFLNRRHLVAAAGIGTAGVAGAFLASRFGGPAMAEEPDPTLDLYPAERNPRYTLEREITPEEINTTYNNFYEYGLRKNIWREAEQLQTRPWEVQIGGLVEDEFTIGIDELIRQMPIEERLYRHRCVEAWSMRVPWTGFALAELVKLARPLGSAKYVEMKTFMDPGMAPGQRIPNYPWPYTEGLSMAEAMNELPFMVIGAYGKPVAKSMGAPLRLHVPWKYGFKSVKSITQISFVEKQPLNLWQEVLPQEYGFWANVNPEVPHRRWSQASERDITNNETIPTQLFNGYAEFVADLYVGMEEQPLYM